MRYFRRKLLDELERKREKIIMYKIILMTRKINCMICGGCYLNQPSKKRIHMDTNKHKRSLYDMNMEKRYTEAEVEEIIRRKLCEIALS